MIETPTITREQWLIEAARALEPTMTLVAPLPEKLRFSCSWPSARGMSAKKPTIGQCWPPEASADGTTEIFISPRLQDPVRVLDVLLHELIHAAIGTKHKHDKTFGAMCRKVGLEGKPTATHAGDDLKEMLTGIAEELGPWPHAELGRNPEEKKQKGRMFLVYCPNDECSGLDVKDTGFRTRLTRVWIESMIADRLGGDELELTAPCWFCEEPLHAVLPEGVDDD